MAIFLVEKEEQEYKDKCRAAGETEPDKERETIQSSNEINLGMAGTMIEGTDTSESGAEKPPIGCGHGLSASSSPDHRPQPQSAAHQGRQGI